MENLKLFIKIVIICLYVFYNYEKIYILILNIKIVSLILIAKQCSRHLSGEDFKVTWVAFLF